jgi:hypothetical protein
MFVGQDAASSSPSSVCDTVFVGFCRVFSGTISVGDELYSTPNFNTVFPIKILHRHVLAPRFSPLTPESSHHRLLCQKLQPCTCLISSQTPQISLQHLQNFAALYAHGPRFTSRFLLQITITATTTTHCRRHRFNSAFSRQCPEYALVACVVWGGSAATYSNMRRCRQRR